MLCNERQPVTCYKKVRRGIPHHTSTVALLTNPVIRDETVGKRHQTTKVPIFEVKL